ncbi:hypothetical protein FHS25_004473 [Rhizobium laguerreae]|uniref:Uncharacterized protein n=1 Tax=Rhizobium laguerreae TaxID=1076926 RepID=A0ABR6GCI1_9HYPH|nr:hypothetical protein [Rhizobium laguerreae]MBB3163978.1 hypothetical protein [Rhizobium laguerreae]
MLKPEATLRRRQVKTRCNMGSSPIDLQMALRMQTSCQPQTRKSPSDRGMSPLAWLFPRRRDPFFGNRLLVRSPACFFSSNAETGLSWHNDFYIENYLPS